MYSTIKFIAAGALAAFLALAGYAAYLQLTVNFHEVVPGELYRAAQMDGSDLARWKREYGIASVLNLRGDNSGKDWYEAERGVADRLGIAHLDFGISARKQLDAETVAALLRIMRDAPKPVLIHCQGGADRTGLASALYLAAIKGRGEDESESQLSLRYGHFGIPGLSQAWPMDETWERAESSLGFPES
ncbi:dual specificity protein phosphatase family protein [Sulfitobacter sp. LCG007]